MKKLMKSRKAGKRNAAYHRRTTRHTAVGRIFPPVDVRNSGSMNEVLKRIKAGPITIMLVYADWCGHCKDFKPHFDAATRTPGRSIQAVKVNDTAFPQLNSAIQGMNASAKPLSVESYPTVLLLDNKGNQITEVNAVQDTQTMRKVMEEAGQNAEEVALNSPKPPSNSFAPKTLGSFNSASIKGSERKATPFPVDPILEAIESLPPVVSTNSESAEEVAANIVQPPGNEDDMITSMKGGGRRKGGCLYGAISSSIYKLAPAAVLLGLASATMRRNRKHQQRRSARKTLRRRR